MRQLRINCVAIVLLVSCMHATNLWSSQAGSSSTFASGGTMSEVVSVAALTATTIKDPSEKQEKEKKEKQSVSDSVFVCHIPTIDEEFSFLKFIISSLQFLKDNNYYSDLGFPKHPSFKKFYENPALVAEMDCSALKKVFIAEIYDKQVYERGFDEISSKKIQEPVQCALAKLMELQKNWGFKIFPRYAIDLTLYGTGGSYNPYTGSIAMKVSSRGAPLTVAKTIIHETVHMGIEENIVQKYKLAHWEKERLVDLICSLYLAEILPDYSIQKSGDKRIDPYITLDAIVHNLPAAIEQFVKQYSR